MADGKCDPALSDNDSLVTMLQHLYSENPTWLKKEVA